MVEQVVTVYPDFDLRAIPRARKRERPADERRGAPLQVRQRHSGRYCRRSLSLGAERGFAQEHASADNWSLGLDCRTEQICPGVQYLSRAARRERDVRADAVAERVLR